MQNSSYQLKSAVQNIDLNTKYITRVYNSCKCIVEHDTICINMTL